MKLALLAAAATAAFSAAPAFAQAPAGPDDVRVNQLIVYGEDACPKSNDEEIIVCARRPEADRYRIPENLRTREGPASRSWTDQAIELSYEGRTGIGSCTPVGPGGGVGCFNQLVNQARAERRDSENWTGLVEQARRERLERIDAEAEAIEREQNPPK